MSERNYWKVSTTYSYSVMVFDVDGVTPKTGLLNAAFTKKLAKDDVNSAVVQTVTEVDGVNFPGLYKVTYTLDATEDAHYVSWVAHPTYAPQGWMDEVQGLSVPHLIDLLDVMALDGQTLRKFLKILLSFFGGKTSGFPGSPVMRDAADTKDRITATVDGNGNRTAVTLDGA